jgi:uncharacterized protein (DUF1810 family)
MTDPFDLQRFVRAQDAVYSTVRGELARGRKETHWIWFVFPQIAGLGQSPMAIRYAISSRDEAEAYLVHPVLGPRLLECTDLVNGIADRAIEDVFEYPDNLKFRSSMTLFAHVAPECEAFDLALRKYFDGGRDLLTLDRLKQVR